MLLVSSVQCGWLCLKLSQCLPQFHYPKKNSKLHKAYSGILDQIKPVLLVGQEEQFKFAYKIKPLKADSEGHLAITPEGDSRGEPENISNAKSMAWQVLTLSDKADWLQQSDNTNQPCEELS